MNLDKVIIAHYKKVKKLNNEYFTCIMDETDISIWYILVKGLNYPYKDGEYIFKIIIDDNFPDSPPSLRCLTPNGVFIADGLPICVSIGEFHKNNYRSGLGIYGFILNSVINAMIYAEEGKHGIRYEVEPYAEREMLAKKSVEYNITTHPNLYSRFYP